MPTISPRHQLLHLHFQPAEYGGGIYQNSNDTLAVSGSTFRGQYSARNTAVRRICPATAYICNSTIAANQALYGGGIISYQTLTLANCTISANVAISRTGGYASRRRMYANSGDATIYNTIVAANTLTITPASNITGTLDAQPAAGQTVSSSNLIGAGGSGGLINGTSAETVGVSPGLGTLQNNGGPTDTMGLLAGSAAIDAGNNALALDANGNALATDQRGAGFPRIINGTVDIGAYEFQRSQGQVSGQVVRLGAARSPSTVSPHQPRSANLPKSPAMPNAGQAVPGFGVPAVTPAASPYLPVEIRDAYGVNDIFFNGVAGTGAGQTIAIVDAYNDPNIFADANTFSADYGLPQFNVSGGPTLQVLSQTGTTRAAIQPARGTWDIEESLDVEWAHAIAPNANIILFEANSANNSDLNAAVTEAANTPGVSVVSMSYLSYQLIDFVAGVSETGNDSIYTTPAGHQGVTFFAATGDQGSPGPRLSRAFTQRRRGRWNFIARRHR